MTSGLSPLDRRGHDHGIGAGDVLGVVADGLVDAERLQALRVALSLWSLPLTL